METHPDKGAVFISYAHKDGKDEADQADGLLRAAGVPVWRDARDLGVGRTDEEISADLAQCAEGLVILTDYYPQSGFAYPKEFKQFGDQRGSNNQWMFTIHHTRKTPGGDLDYQAPDRMLAEDPLDSTNQVDLLDQPLAQMYLGKMVGNRLARVLRDADPTEPLCLHVNTYVQEVAAQAPDHGLFINLDLNGDLTQAKGLDYLAWSLPVTSRSLSRFRAPQNPPPILLSGGAHPTVAVAIGAALSVTRYRGSVTAMMREPEPWLDGTVTDPGTSTITADSVRHIVDDESRGPVAVFVNFTRGAVVAFDELVEGIRGNIAAAVRIDRVGRGGHDSISPGEGKRLAEEAAEIIRDLARGKDTNEIHLCVAAPFPIAFHLGRLLNTFMVHLWELGASSEGSRYRRTLTLNTDGEILRVYAEPSDPAQPPLYR